MYISRDKNGNARFLNKSVNVKTSEPALVSSGSMSLDLELMTLCYGDRMIELDKVLGETKNKVYELSLIHILPCRNVRFSVNYFREKALFRRN